MTTPKPICSLCGNRGRSGPRNSVCPCKLEPEPYISLASRPPYRCGQCNATWSRASGSHRCPECGFDLDLGVRPKFSQAHAHVRGIVTGDAPDIVPEPDPKRPNPDDWSDLNWSGGYI